MVRQSDPGAQRERSSPSAATSDVNRVNPAGMLVPSRETATKVLVALDPEIGRLFAADDPPIPPATLRTSIPSQETSAWKPAIGADVRMEIEIKLLSGYKPYWITPSNPGTELGSPQAKQLPHVSCRNTRNAHSNI